MSDIEDIEFNDLIDQIKSVRINDVIIKVIREALADDDVYPHSRFTQDLYCVELDIVDIIMRLEKIFGFYIPDNMCEPETVMDLIITIRSLLSNKLKNN
jgi:acyl carrier protein